MFHGHFDSDWASLIDGIRSTTSFRFNLDQAYFSWCSRKQDMVAQSIAEAEYVAITITTNQAFLAWKITY